MGLRSRPRASVTPAECACGTLRNVMVPATPPPPLPPRSPRPRSSRLCRVSESDPSSFTALRAHCARATHRSHACDFSDTSHPAYTSTTSVSPGLGTHRRSRIVRQTIRDPTFSPPSPADAERVCARTPFRSPICDTTRRATKHDLWQRPSACSTPTRRCASGSATPSSPRRGGVVSGGRPGPR